MLRLLIEDVTLVRGDRAIHIAIRWKWGATTSLERPRPLGAADLKRTPPAIVEQVRVLATEQTDRQIADTLNGRWLRSGAGKRFTRLRVRTIREAYAIPSLADHLRDAGWLTVAQMTAQLGVHHTTAKRFACEGVLRATRADDSGRILFEPPTGPHCPPCTRASDSVIAAGILSVRSTCGRSCSMKPEPCPVVWPGAPAE